MATRKPKLNGGGPGIVDMKADPNANIPFLLGRTAASGNIAFHRTSGDQNNFLNYYIILSGAGPIDAIERFEVNNEVVSFGADQGYGAQGRYQNRMWARFQLGNANDPALNIPATGTKWTPGSKNGNPVEWTSQHTLPSKAALQWCLFADTKVYANGTPRELVVARGIKHYDRRKDDTAPGGVGLQRANDPATWAYSDNPYVVASTYMLGFFELNTTANKWVRVGGMGMPADAIDWDAFIFGMNVCDANGWKVSGQITSGTAKWGTLATILQSGGGMPAHRGAKVSCLVSAPRVSTFTITSADLLGQAVVDAGALMRERINTAIPRYTSEAAGWKPVAGQKVFSQVYVDEDGEESKREVTLDLVANNKQAHELAAYHVGDQRELLQVTVNVGPKFMDVRTGDAGVINVPELGLNGQKVIVHRRRFDPATWAYTFTLRSETDSKHPWALGQVAAPASSVSLTARNPADLGPPRPGFWVVAPTTLPAPPPGNPVVVAPIVPGITITPAPGVVTPTQEDNGSATSVIVRYRPLAEPPSGVWAYQEYPNTTTAIELAGLLPATTYQVELAYRVAGVESPYQPQVNITTGPLVATNTVAVGGRPSADVLVQIDAVAGQINAAVASERTAREQADALLSSADTNFDGRINTIVGNVTGLQSGQTNLQTQIDGRATITQLNFQISRIDGHNTQIGSLQTTVNDLPNQYASVTNYNTLLSEVTNARGTQLSLSARFTAQQQSITDGLSGKASVTDVNALTTRVGTAEGTIGSHSTRLSTVESDVAGRALATELDTLEAEVVGARNGSLSLHGQLTSMRQVVTDGLAARVLLTDYNALVGRMNTAEGNISGSITRLDQIDLQLPGFASVSQFNTLNAEVTTARQGRTSLNAWITEVNQARADGDGVLSSQISSLGGEISTERSRVTAGNTRMDNIQLDVNGRATATQFTSLNAEVTDARQGRPTLNAFLTAIDQARADGDSASATRSSTIEARLTGTGDVSARITDTNTVAVNAQGVAYAIRGVVLDVNGYASGWSSTNNGASASFTINADKFEVRRPGSTERMELVNNCWNVYDAAGNLRVRMGKLV